MSHHSFPVQRVMWHLYSVLEYAARWPCWRGDASVHCVHLLLLPLYLANAWSQRLREWNIERYSNNNDNNDYRRVCKLALQQSRMVNMTLSGLLYCRGESVMQLSICAQLELSAWISSGIAPLKKISATYCGMFLLPTSMCIKAVFVTFILLCAMRHILYVRVFIYSLLFFTIS